MISDAQLKEEREIFLEVGCGGTIYSKVIDKIVEHVTDMWLQMPDPGSYTIHNFEHNKNVETYIYKLIPRRNYKDLNIREKFILIASVWLHDIGMVPIGLLGGDKSHVELFSDELGPSFNEEWNAYIKKIRKKHSDRSKKYIMENMNIFAQFVEIESNSTSTKDEFAEDFIIIGEISSLHTKNQTEKLVTLCSRDWSRDNIRKPLIAAYLRLADALHISDKGNLGDIHNTFAKNTRNDTIYHWLKSYFTDSVDIDPENHLITLKIITTNEIEDFHNSRTTNNKRLVEEQLIQEIIEELEFIKEILCRSHISYYCDVVSERINYSHNPSKNHILMYYYYYLILLQLSNLEFSNAKTASSTLIESEILDTITHIIHKYSIAKTESEKRDNKLSLRNYYNCILTQTMDKKSLHGKIEEWRIFVKEFLDSDDPQALISLNNAIFQKQNGHKNTLDLLSGNFYKEFERFASSVGDVNIISYGYSSSVHKCLERIKFLNVSFHFYICEVGSKTRYSFNNKLEFSDGLLNIEQIQHIFSETSNYSIHYLPDAVISRLLDDLNSQTGQKTLVLLGTDVFDDDYTIALTCGALTIVQIARDHKIPVWIVTEKAKKVDHYIKVKAVQREQSWLASDPHSLTILSKCDSYNPRQDVIPKKYLNKLITEDYCKTINN